MRLTPGGGGFTRDDGRISPRELTCSRRLDKTSQTATSERSLWQQDLQGNRPCACHELLPTEREETDGYLRYIALRSMCRTVRSSVHEPSEKGDFQVGQVQTCEAEKARRTTENEMRDKRQNCYVDEPKENYTQPSFGSSRWDSRPEGCSPGTRRSSALAPRKHRRPTFRTRRSGLSPPYRSLPASHVRPPTRTRRVVESGTYVRHMHVGIGPTA